MLFAWPHRPFIARIGDTQEGRRPLVTEPDALVVSPPLPYCCYGTGARGPTGPHVCAIRRSGYKHAILRMGRAPCERGDERTTRESGLLGPHMRGVHHQSGQHYGQRGRIQARKAVGNMVHLGCARTGNESGRLLAGLDPVDLLVRSRRSAHIVLPCHQLP